MICSNSRCKHLLDFGFCSVYSPQGVIMRNRLGYCPIVDDGPARPKVEQTTQKRRVGQQKQKKHK